MLDELRDLFLAALTFDGDDAMPLVIKWNKEIDRIQAVFDRMTDKGVDAVPVVRCKDCKHYQHDAFLDHDWCDGRCVTPDYFCADGERRSMDGGYTNG